MDLNEEQKKAVFCAENAVVAAGAGSGKTMVLANRFAWLLTEKGLRIDQILTLTFTKKAASQMFRRIHSLLTSITNNEDGVKTEAQRARAAQALDDFTHARIQTLDSYSTALARQCASRYGINPEFEINPDRSREIATEEALPFLIKHRHHPAIEKLYSDSRPNDIAHNIFSEILNNHCLIDKKRDFTSDIKKQFDVVCKEWENQIKEISVIFNELKNYQAEIHVMCPYLVPVMDKYKDKNIKLVPASDIRNFLDLLLKEPLETVMEKAKSHPLQTLLQQLLYYTADLNQVKINMGKPRNNPVKDNLLLLRALYGKFSSLIVYCKQAGLMLSFMSLLNDLQDRYLQRKRAEGVLTFSDVASLSRTILLEQKDIRQSEKESFKAIMIDEFQDNNDLQKDLLFLLAEKDEVLNDTVPTAGNLKPDKLFFVGDEKQSVYLFRGADVSVFRKLKDEIKAVNLPLKSNYRSVSALIGAFNAIFGGSRFDPAGKAALHEYASVFARESSPSLPVYEAVYTPLESKQDGDGSLSICILNEKDGKKNKDEMSANTALLSPVENEARYAAEKIALLLEEKTETGKQKYKPDDIAILFRTHTHQYLFEKHLRLLGIPYECENINDLFYSGVVNDIMSVLRLAAHPLDSASYAEMLRSPFAGLSLGGTAACLSVLKDESAFTPFNDEPLSFLSDEDREKYLHGRSIYCAICEKAAKENIASLVSELWYNEGYRYETEWHPNTSVYREYFDYLYHLAVSADTANQGLALFTESILNLRDSGSRLKDIVIPLDRSGAVHLMTIHKSKGLEFKVVFVCCCGKHSVRNQLKKVYDSNTAGIVFSPPLPAECYNVPDIKKNFFWEQVKTEESRKNTAELRRLLYVAMTRAEQKLFLTGSLDISCLDIANDSETGDFSLLIKSYINKKYEEKEKKDEIYIEDDSIINNDTLFGLLLPAISSHIPADFFNIEQIPVYTEEYIRNQEIKDNILKNDQKGLNEYFEKAESFYENAQIIKTPVIYDNHFSPVSLQQTETDNAAPAMPEKSLIINKEFSGDKSEDVFDNVDAMLLRLSKNNDERSRLFNPGSFGTIAHLCVEALLNKHEEIIPSSISCLVKPSDLESLLDAGKELAKRFVLSPLGKIAQNAGLRESEFSFRSLIKNKDGEIFINGTVDLFFEDKNCIHIVDFKTDVREIPDRYSMQMACYYQAVSALYTAALKKECRIWLYYLRTGHAVEMTETVKHINIEPGRYNKKER